jgi:hypothetical protein
LEIAFEPFRMAVALEGQDIEGVDISAGIHLAFAEHHKIIAAGNLLQHDFFGSSELRD